MPPRKLTERQIVLRRYFTEIKAVGKHFTVWLKVDGQSFQICGEHTREEAVYFRNMLAVALSNINR